MSVKKTYYFKIYIKILIIGVFRVFDIQINIFQNFFYIIKMRNKSKNHYSIMIIVKFILFSQCFKFGLNFFQQTNFVDVY